MDEEVLLGLEELRVGKALVTDLVESVGGVGDKLAEEDLLVRVELRGKGFISASLSISDDYRSSFASEYDPGQEGEGRK